MDVNGRENGGSNGGGGSQSGPVGQEEMHLRRLGREATQVARKPEISPKELKGESDEHLLGAMTRRSELLSPKSKAVQR